MHALAIGLAALGSYTGWIFSWKQAYSGGDVIHARPAKHYTLNLCPLVSQNRKK